MTVNYEYVRRIILNDRLLGYRPDRKSLEKLRERLPDVKVIGFGIWSRTYPLYNTWFLLVESKRFWADHSPAIDAIPMNQLPYAPKLNLVPELSPPKSPA